MSRRTDTGAAVRSGRNLPRTVRTRAHRAAQERLTERLLDGQQAVRAVELRVADHLGEQSPGRAVVDGLGQAEQERDHIERDDAAVTGQHQRGERRH
jgi:hypothetical protein